jgi:hypothetical protein
VQANVNPTTPEEGLLMTEPPMLTAADAATWFEEAMPDGWFHATRVLIDRDEILVVGTLDPAAAVDNSAADVHDDDIAHIEQFREETREARIAIAQEAESRFGRKVSWATRCGTNEATFTHLSVPVMTRLRMRERQLLDTLIAAGVARSRSDALGWCVRLVDEHQGEWLDELRDAIAAVDQIRGQGPA